MHVTLMHYAQCSNKIRDKPVIIYTMYYDRIYSQINFFLRSYYIVIFHYYALTVSLKQS